MVKPQICSTEAEIRRVLDKHLAELVVEKQEVKIAWKNDRIPVPRIITGYEPPEPKGEYADALFVLAYDNDVKENVVIITTPGELTHFEVLSTRRMTPALGLKQMKEMERAAGLKTD